MKGRAARKTTKCFLLLAGIQGCPPPEHVKTQKADLKLARHCKAIMKVVGFIVFVLPFILLIAAAVIYGVVQVCAAANTAPPWVGAVFVLWLISRK